MRYAGLSKKAKRRVLRHLQDKQALREVLVVKRTDQTYDIHPRVDDETARQVTHRMRKHPVEHATLYTTNQMTGQWGDAWRDVDWFGASRIYKHRINAKNLRDTLDMYRLNNRQTYLYAATKTSHEGMLKLLTLLTSDAPYSDAIYSVDADTPDERHVLRGDAAFKRYRTQNKDRVLNVRCYTTQVRTKTRNVEVFVYTLGAMVEIQNKTEE